MEFLQSHKIESLERKIDDLEKQLARYTKVQPKVAKKSQDNLALPPVNVTQSLDFNASKQPAKSSFRHEFIRWKNLIFRQNPRFSKQLIKKEGLNAYDERFCGKCVKRQNYYEKPIGTGGFKFGYYCASCDNPVQF